MKDYFNFEAILSIIFLVLAIFALRSNIQRKKQLGEIVYPTLNGVKHSDFLMQTVLIAFMFVFLVLSAVFNAQSGKNYILFFIVFPVALIIYFANNILQLKTQKGLYENGAFTSNGSIFYSEIVKYETVSMQTKNYVRFRINPKATFLSSNSYLDVPIGEEGALKSQLKKKASFKKKTYTPPPKKNKR